MNTYEINDRNEVIPYTNGRRCTDTMAWRDATELELQQQDEIKSLERELAAVTEQRDRLAEALIKCREDSVCEQARMERCRYTKAADESQANIDRADKALQSLTTNDQGDPLRAGSGRRNTKDTL